MIAGLRSAAATAALCAFTTGLLFCFPGSRDWMLLPLSGLSDHHIPAWEAWHGRLMVAAWAILIPAGTIAARYFKIWPGQDWPTVLDDQRWWMAHRLLQTAGIVLATLGVLLAWPRAAAASPIATLHGLLGWTIMALGWLQILSGLLRGSKGGPTDPRAAPPAFRGDHFTMAPRRIIFEWTHKLGGYASLLLILAVIPMGLVIADAPRWMPIVIGEWWIALGWTAVLLQRDGKCLDTYQAIWGLADDLPGQRLAPIGWGISRVTRARED